MALRRELENQAISGVSQETPSWFPVAFAVIGTASLIVASINLYRQVKISKARKRELEGWERGLGRIKGNW